MTIANCAPPDIEEIFRLYRLATEYQKTKGSVIWPEFERELVKKEIEEKRQWKIMVGDSMVCVFATTFNDPFIWQEKDKEPSVYIHRIATDPRHRGNNFVMEIVSWARAYAKENGKSFIRLDTVGKNIGLINYYQKCGFNFLGLFRLQDTSSLPAHYHNASVSLFEISF